MATLKHKLGILTLGTCLITTEALNAFGTMCSSFELSRLCPSLNIWDCAPSLSIRDCVPYFYVHGIWLSWSINGTLIYFDRMSQSIGIMQLNTFLENVVSFMSL